MTDNDPSPLLRAIEREQNRQQPQWTFLYKDSPTFDVWKAERRRKRRQRRVIAGTAILGLVGFFLRLLSGFLFVDETVAATLGGSLGFLLGVTLVLGVLIWWQRRGSGNE